MSSNKASSDPLATNSSATASNGTTSLGNNASQMSSPASKSKSKSQKGNSYMLDAWVKEPPSSGPWSPLNATYSPRS
ncbi:unnamed protein product [Penicillium glandicola]